MSTSGSYHHGDLRAALLHTAGKILEKEGLASVNVRKLARRAGVSHNAPYRHFPDRESLLAALAGEGFELLGNALESRPRREMGEAYVEFALAHPQRFRLMCGQDRRTHERLQEAFADLGPNARYAAAAAWALVHGLSHLLLDGHFAGEERREFIRKVLGTVRFSAPRTA